MTEAWPPRRSRGTQDGAVSAVLGGILMMALMLTMVPGALMLQQAMNDAMTAQRQAAEHAAYCARNPRAENCDAYGPMPGYDCAQSTLDVYVCVAHGQEVVPGTLSVPLSLLAPAGATPSPAPTTTLLSSAAPSTGTTPTGSATDGTTTESTLAPVTNTSTTSSLLKL